MNELWKDINGYEGLYQVSSLGRVRRIGQKDSLGRLRSFSNDRCLQPLDGPTQRYVMQRLYKNGIGQTIPVHKLVAEAFLKTPSCCPTCGHQLEVDHKDQNSKNNSVENLAYVSRRENVTNAKQKQLRSCRKKLSEEQVKIIKRLLVDTTLSGVEIAKQMGVHASTICGIKHRRTWASIT